MTAFCFVICCRVSYRPKLLLQSLPIVLFLIIASLFFIAGIYHQCIDVIFFNLLSILKVYYVSNYIVVVFGRYFNYQQLFITDRRLVSYCFGWLMWSAVVYPVCLHYIEAGFVH